MTDASIELRDGRWFMIIGDEASPMDAVISSMLNAKRARMLEAQRTGQDRRARAMADLAEQDGELLP
jgi:hypothetical protein